MGLELALLETAGYLRTFRAMKLHAKVLIPSAFAIAAPLAQAIAQTVVQPRDAVMWSAILSAEDSRPTMAQALGPLAGGLRYADAEMRRLAVRGLGRLERDTIRSPNGTLSLIGVIAYALHDSAAGVRAEAANALAQAAQHDGMEAARDSLLAQLKEEQDPRVRGMIGASLGRLPFRVSASIETALLELSADTALSVV